MPRQPVALIDANSRRCIVEYQVGTSANYKEVILKLDKWSHRAEVYDCKFSRVLIRGLTSNVSIMDCNYLDITLDKSIVGIEMYNCRHCKISYTDVVPSVRLDTCLDVTVQLLENRRDDFVFVTSSSYSIIINYNNKKHYVPDSLINKYGTVTEYSISNFTQIKRENDKNDRSKAINPKCIDILGDISIITLC
ncbi:cap [Acrasis kona]|uniref:Cap n=1 Tax=Acrasis kona TaxID=1008807 RepID=A0AAW2Z3L6_9EUKA